MADMNSHAAQSNAVGLYDHQRLWRFGFWVSLIVAIAGFGTALQQAVFKLWIDQAVHTRTTWGIAFIALGFVGPILPWLMFKKRREFARTPRARQWTAAIGVPLVYVAVMVSCTR